jgi:MoxR-like ATPase
LWQLGRIPHKVFAFLDQYSQNNIMTTQIEFLKISTALESSILGQSHVIRALLIALLCNGNVLLEGLPGTAKTRSIKTLAAALSVSLGRIQFTPDLLPSDVTGTEIYQEVDGKPNLSFQKGPIFNNLILADEINRAPAKVQSALLEAMEERQVTFGGKTYALPDLFMVLATQNPIEQEGTYPLPEAQMDRFLMKINADYPDESGELEILRMVRGEEGSTPSTNEIITINPAVVFDARAQVHDVHMSENIENYVVAIVMATREPARFSPDLASWIDVGASPRATIGLDRCARAHAWLAGRDFVDPDDVRIMAPQVLRHRLTLSYDAIADGVSADAAIDEILRTVAVA